MNDTPSNTAERIARIPVPARIARLPRDDRGYFIPRFVHYRNGKPDFRVMDPAHLVGCVNRNMCWVCGGPLGRHKVFVVGPMCTISRTSSEPPSHLDCAEYAAKVCPFLVLPHMRRLPTADLNIKTVGLMIERNPGVVALWTTGDYKWWRQDQGLLFQMGDPERVEWWTQGRAATREEVNESVRTGFPALLEVCNRDANPVESRDELQRMLIEATRYFPPMESNSEKEPTGTTAK